MTTQIRLWASAVHHPAFRCGGWAAVRAMDGLLTGVAGGERSTTPERMALSALAAGLADLPPVKTGGVPPVIAIETSSPVLGALKPILESLDTPRGEAPEDNLDLWARILSASRGRRLALALVPHRPDTASAFAAAWADLAMDRGKARGAFSTAIPKANLLKAPGMA